MKTGIWVFAGPRNHNTNNEREQSRPLEHNTGQGNNKGTSVSTPPGSFFRPSYWRVE